MFAVNEKNGVATGPHSANSLGKNKKQLQKYFL